MQRQHLQKLSREELVREAERAGVPRPRVLTQAELIDEILKRTAASDRDRARARGWLGRARDLLATVVEKGLHLPDAAAAIRQGAKGWPPPPPPLATVTLAEIYAAQGHLERAVSVLDEVLQREPDHEEARELRARFQAQLQHEAGGEAGPSEGAGAAEKGETPEPASSAEAARGAAPQEGNGREATRGAEPGAVAANEHSEHSGPVPEPPGHGKAREEARVEPIAPPVAAAEPGGRGAPMSAPPTMPAVETRDRGESMEGSTEVPAAQGGNAIVAGPSPETASEEGAADRTAGPPSAAMTSRSPSAPPATGPSIESAARIELIVPAELATPLPVAAATVLAPGAPSAPAPPGAPAPVGATNEAPASASAASAIDAALADTAPAEVAARVEIAVAGEAHAAAVARVIEAATTEAASAEEAAAAEVADEAAAPGIAPAEEIAASGAAVPVEAGPAGEAAPSAPALPVRYDVDEIVAIAVDPSTFYVYWEVRPTTFAHAAAQAPGGWLALRVTAVTPGWDGPIVETRDIRIDALFGDRFVHHVRPRADVRVSVGWLAEGRFDPIAVGTEVSAPRAFVAAGAPVPVGAPLDLSEGPHGAHGGGGHASVAFGVSAPEQALATHGHAGRIALERLAAGWAPRGGAALGQAPPQHTVQIVPPGGGGGATGLEVTFGPSGASMLEGPWGEEGQQAHREGVYWYTWTEGGEGEGSWWTTWTDVWSEGEDVGTTSEGTRWRTTFEGGTWGGASEGGRWGGASEGGRWGGASERRMRWGGASERRRWGGASEGGRWGGASERRVRWGGASERAVRWGGASERAVPGRTGMLPGR